MENHNGVVLLDDERKFDEMLLVSTECWRRMTDRQTDGHISTESVSRKFWDWTLVASRYQSVTCYLFCYQSRDYGIGEFGRDPGIWDTGTAIPNVNIK